MHAVEERVDAPVVASPGRKRNDVEQLHAPLAEVGSDVAAQRHHDHADIQQPVTEVRGDPLPSRHGGWIRRRRVSQAPVEPEQNQQTQREARRLVQVDEPGPVRCPARNLIEIPAQADLCEETQRDQPVQHDRDVGVPRLATRVSGRRDPSRLRIEVHRIAAHQLTTRA